MSCSSVKITGGPPSKRTPPGHPLLIANLRGDLNTPKDKDWLLARCHTNGGTWIRYPERYKGINEPIVAEPPNHGSQVQFIDFSDPDDACGSDNVDLLNALALDDTCKSGLSIVGKIN
jgi:hypothetical protein